MSNWSDATNDVSSFLKLYLWKQRAWSLVTFGEGKRTVGITAHIAKELDEIRAQPDDLEEWIDVIILALDGYWRAGGQPDTIEWQLREKQDKNFARQWPERQPEDHATEHIR